MLLIFHLLNFKSLPHLLDYFKDEEKAVKYFEMMRWSGNPTRLLRLTTRGYKCSNNECYKKFTVKVGTIFECSKIPFRIWFAVIYLCGNQRYEKLICNQIFIEQSSIGFFDKVVKFIRRRKFTVVVSGSKLV